MRIVLDGKALETSLIHMPAAGIVPVRVPSLRVRQGRPTHEGTRIRRRGRAKE